VQPFLQWKSIKYNIFCACVCSFRYPACNAHLPYFSLRPTRLYNIFSHFLIKGTTFGNKKLNMKCVSISHSKIKWTVHFRIYSCIFISSACYSCQNLMKFQFYIFWKNTLSKFIKIRPMAAELSYAERRTDMTKQIVAFRNFANALKNIYCKL